MLKQSCSVPFNPQSDQEYSNLKGDNMMRAMKQLGMTAAIIGTMSAAPVLAQEIPADASNFYKSESVTVRQVSFPNVVAIGETGLDKGAEAPLDCQREIFRASASLAENAGVFLIIHCVKAWDELIASKKELKPRVPWIIHGFRGNATLAGQLIRQGFYLSFGEYFNPGAVREAWPGRLFAETDDREIDIRTVYRNLSVSLNLRLEQFAGQIAENVRDILHLP